ncbi:hypothetical protein J3U75_06560 [Snodgrassella sp. B3088]|uniref:hypothetical protein n=1 Tax=Snodgrassella sp. B3088 TaxID=2818038 RepID=UPI00226A23CF|nr:hypothetical protein [Snodgrassella sp. B3088]MCX8749043.1 hypothetical protein [Snodgrassella sp. B3088]
MTKEFTLNPVITPILGSMVYIADYINADGYILDSWGKTPYKCACLNAGLIYTTNGEARLVSNMFINIFEAHKNDFDYLENEPKNGDLVYAARLSAEGHYLALKYKSGDHHFEQAWRNHMLFKNEDKAIYACKTAIAVFNKVYESELYHYYTTYPDNGTKVYTPSPRNSDGFICIDFNSDNLEHKNLLDLGLCFFNPEDAKKVASTVKPRVELSKP